jgi:nucleotide-binding universal stress UspA family protein
MALAPKLILVPVDVDNRIERSLTENLVASACDVALAFHASLLFVHAAPPVAMAYGSPLDTVTMGNEAARAMGEMLQAHQVAALAGLDALCALAKTRGVTARSQILTDPGNIAELVVTCARDTLADLIIIASHSRTGLSRFVLGSVAERTAHLSPVPVLMIPSPRA